jgi:hypothetical protein
MNEAKRRVWLATLLTTQLRALCHAAGIYDLSLEWSRAKMIESLCLVERIEIPQATT